MDEVLLQFSKPEVIASAVVTISLLLIAPIIEKGRNLVIQKGNGILRSVRLKDRKKIKKLRQNGDEVTFQSIKAHAYLVLFLGSIATFWWLIIFGPARGIGSLPTSVQLLLSLPIYIFEILWLLQHGNARDLVISRGKLRITAGKRFQSYQK